MNLSLRDEHKSVVCQLRVINTHVDLLVFNLVAALGRRVKRILIFLGTTLYYIVIMIHRFYQLHSSVTRTNRGYNCSFCNSSCLLRLLW